MILVDVAKGGVFEVETHSANLYHPVQGSTHKLPTELLLHFVGEDKVLGKPLIAGIHGPSKALKALKLPVPDNGGDCLTIQVNAEKVVSPLVVTQVQGGVMALIDRSLDSHDIDCESPKVRHSTR